MADQSSTKAVERMFPFVIRSRGLIVGRDQLLRNKRRLHFVLLTTDLSEGSRETMLKEFAHYPVVQHYTAADLDAHFGLKNTKVVGFVKSGLAQSIYAELKSHRVNKPPRSKSDSERAAAREGEKAEQQAPDAQGQKAAGVKAKRPRPRSVAPRKPIHHDPGEAAGSKS